MPAKLADKQRARIGSAAEVPEYFGRREVGHESCTSIPLSNGAGPGLFYLSDGRTYERKNDYSRDNADQRQGTGREGAGKTFRSGRLQASLV